MSRVMGKPALRPDHGKFPSQLGELQLAPRIAIGTLIGMFGASPWLSARSVLLHVILVYSLLLSSHACAHYGLFYIGLCHYVSGTKPTFARHYPSTGQSRVPQTALCFIRRRLRYACSHNPCIFLCSLLPVDRPSSCPCRPDSCQIASSVSTLADERY